MVILFEIYLSLLRILILLLGVFFTVFFGAEVLVKINDFLVNQAGLPCLEIFSFLALVVIPLAILYGVHAQKYFWQRRLHYNLVILGVCFLTGIFLTILPLDSALMISNGVTNMHVSTLSCYPVAVSWITHALGTALIAILFGFIGMDLGVSLKHASRKVRSHRATQAEAKVHKTMKPAKTTKKKRK